MRNADGYDNLCIDVRDLVDGPGGRRLFVEGKTYFIKFRDDDEDKWYETSATTLAASYIGRKLGFVAGVFPLSFGPVITPLVGGAMGGVIAHDLTSGNDDKVLISSNPDFNGNVCLRLGLK